MTRDKTVGYVSLPQRGESPGREMVHLIHGEEKLVTLGCKKSKMKLVVFVIVSVLTFPILPVTYFLLGFWKPSWKTLLLHSYSLIKEADILLIKRREITTPAKVFKIKLQKSDLDNCMVKKLYEHIDENGYISMIEYKLERYVVTREGIDRVGTLGTGQTFQTLLYMTRPEATLAKDTLTQVFGRNVLDVPLPPLIYFVLTEVLTFFYIFQLFSCILWFSNEYVVYATVIMVMSVASASATTYITRTAIVKLRRAVLFQCDVLVKRGGDIQKIKSGELVPGDIVTLPMEQQQLTFDGVLLSGSVVVDEAMLTGESVPTLKTPLPFDRLEDEFWAEKHEVNTVFSGTTILQTRPPISGDDQNVYCLVTKTTFDTKKGETVKFMLHPKKSQIFKFYSEAWTYVKIMAGIGLAGMIYTIYDSVVNEYSPTEAFVTSLDLITIIIAPSLPLALSISIGYAIRRLKKHHIKVALPNSINVAGKVKLTVFDKTGTMTEEGLTLQCVLTSRDGIFSGEQVLQVAEQIRPGLATCHALSILQDKICGDSIDLIGQQTSRFTFKDKDFDGSVFTRDVSAVSADPDSGKQYGLVKIYSFESALKRMSVIVEEARSEDAEEAGSGDVTVFCKGAPEEIVLHCEPSSVPQDFPEILNKYSSQGYRIIALARKSLSGDLSSLSRDHIESDMTFLGLLVLANRLKPETRVVIEELCSAGVRTIMCTGDNLLTAVSVARESSMVPDHGDLFLVTAQLSPDKELEVAYTLQKHSPEELFFDDGNLFDGPQRRIHLAMDGSTFTMIANHRPDIMDKVIVTGSVFARFSPEQKMCLIDELQQRSYSVCMCGDGANDCEALQHANVGIALSKCEASLAAPFTSTIFNISCVPVLLKEGQAALENSMAVFRFTAMYSITQYLSVILLIPYKSILGDYQYLLEDLAIVLLFDFALGYTRPVGKLSGSRPKGSLLHPYTVYSFFMQTGVAVGFMLLAMWLVQQQPWYDPFDQIREEYLEEGELYVSYFETTVDFITSSFQYVIMALVFSIGAPHRRPFYTNKPLIVSTLGALAIILMCLFTPPDKIEYLELATIPSLPYKFYMLGLVVCNLVLALAIEYSYRYIAPLQWVLKALRCKRGHKNKFKYLVDEMNLNTEWPVSERPQSEDKL